MSTATAEPVAGQQSGKKPSFLRQPKSVWAVAFACVVSFMGIGLVDPILPTLASDLHASPSQISLLFTSYLLVTSVAMLITGWVSSRIGAKRTLVAGLVIIVVFSALAGLSGGVDGIIGFRAGWGLGNALFIATSLAVIVGAASGGFAGAIMLYEAALGFGIALGPLLGGVLGGISWRGPFFGVAVLMLLALIMVVTLLAPTPRPAQHTPLSAPIKALRHRGLLTVSVTALLYNWGFFTILGYAPYPMHIGVHELGFVFFGWGLLVAIFAVFVAPRAERAIGTARSLYITLVLMAVDVGVIAVWVDRPIVVIVCVILSGAFIGMNNTLVTATVMSVAPVPRPTASAAYSFVRFLGGGLAPWIAGILAAAYGDHLPFAIGAGAVLLGAIVLATAHRLLGARTDEETVTEDAAEELVESAEGNVLHGHLRSADGTPVDGAALTLIDGDGRQVARGRSGGDGYFTVTGQPDGSYVLIANGRGLRPQACPVRVHGEPVRVDMTLAGSGGLRGTVTAARRAAAGVTVTLVDSSGEVAAATRSDEAGGYRFTGLVGGEYVLLAHPAGTDPVVHAVVVPESGELTVDVALPVRAPVVGVARRHSDGAPVAEALVTLVDAAGHTAATTLTGADGGYTFPAVDQGDYTVVVSGYPPVRDALRVRPGVANTVDVTLRQDPLPVPAPAHGTNGSTAGRQSSAA